MAQMAQPWKHPDTGAYYIRREIPEKLRPAFDGKALWKVSLRTKDFARAAILFASANADLEKRFEEARRRVAATGDPLGVGRPAYVRSSVSEPNLATIIAANASWAPDARQDPWPRERAEPTLALGARRPQRAANQPWRNLLIDRDIAIPISGETRIQTFRVPLSIGEGPPSVTAPRIRLSQRRRGLIAPRLG